MREKQMNLSKKLIEDALIRILKKKPLDSISMTEIAKEADVVRMTLYRHFKTKEEIILNIVKRKVDQMISQTTHNTEPKMFDFLLFRFTILKKSPFTETLFNHNHLDKLLAINLLVRQALGEEVDFSVIPADIAPVEIGVNAGY